MRSKNVSSAYSKMYLVSTPVYNKLLSCLDEVDKQSTMDLNKEEETEEIRPSSIILDNLNNIQNSNNLQQPVVEEIQQQQQPISVEDEEDRHIDEIVVENAGVNNLSQPPIQNDIPIVVNEDPINENNKLRTPCNQNVKQKFKKKIRFNPIVSDISRVPSSMVPPGRKTKDIYECDICGKQLARKWGLFRHKQTIHKTENQSLNISSNKNKFSPWDERISDEEEDGEEGGVDEEESKPLKVQKTGPPVSQPSVKQIVYVPQFAKKRSASDAKLPHLIPKRRSTRNTPEESTSTKDYNFKTWNVK